MSDVIIAGGKTGGHLFPGIAVAQALGRLKQDIRVLFVGTRAPFEISTLEKYNLAHTAIYAKAIKGGNILSKSGSMIMIAVSLLQSIMILLRTRPGFVLGVGGFSSFAVVLAAWLLRIPTAIQEQNAYPGLTNRMLSRFARTVFISFENTKGFTGNPKARFVGNPMRRAQDSSPQDTSVLYGFDPEKFTLLITGGSQGAASINTSVVQALELMGSRALNLNIIHQTGKTDESKIKAAYQRLNIPATVSAFFHDMPQLQDMADLIITRAGAGTLSELCAKGKPAILVPFPFAADDHQTFNAKALEEKGAAVMIRDHDLSGQTLKQTIEPLMKNKNKLETMRKALLALAMPDADEKIANHILQTMKARG
ncbi:MAG: undecaprenyldiphospho-muramoylpentapeptide beta-N-acetylglucosaminyltransferase [Proteobacteria bacterium]|nr:undecaprenyldiphospho-muramoylpentapeptide beta-N-acetylglucosaminyltransferase [Pseudomonadota bacterium]MBU1388628.1 undecaprenyldiphospho-muramoylpentapeptide beta-N-acetylglucosaminyltransferase [Pseudomonadota bacterium]MBU1541784.1 undecaprenyldiphospho-muramoylpentapeptide beta-N-acetylglucosaminyltransferase [Pseudomonadota bacterium]MBU2429429.1 undecaprenyldiphospho-muramoylpentapeptide beta-N-acetylglucosaminyltransferase [Pseudomonadota bacterium]MBU2479890.1 undecaprenyldiphosph